MPIKSIIGRYSHAIKVDGTVNPKTKEAYRLNELKSNNEKYVEKAASVVDGNADDPIYVEAYAVFTSHRINPTGRGKVGWSIGGKISNAFVDRDKFLVSGYTWDEDYKIPYRLWASFDYDLRKDLKFVASTWIDNGYKTMDASVAFKDYLGSDGSAPLSIDSMFGTTSLFDFDFGKLAIEKTEAIERIVNGASDKAIRCVEIAGGSPLTEEEINATKKSEINRECPSIANPNYVPYNN